jgi:hypothetical protein
MVEFLLLNENGFWGIAVLTVYVIDRGNATKLWKRRTVSWQETKFLNNRILLK